MIDKKSPFLFPLRLLKKIYVKRFDIIDILPSIIRHNLKPNNFKATPNEVLIGLTYQCNSKCTMCNIWKIRPKNELSYQEWEQIMKDPIFAKIKKLSITGGEASLHPDFEKIITLFINSMPKLKKVGIVSNGFTTELIIKKVTTIAKICQKKGIQLNVSISLDGVGKTHDSIRGIKNAFKMATKTIAELKKLSKKYKIGVGSGSLILRENISKVSEIEKWYADNRVNNNFQIVGFHDTYVRNLDRKKSVDFKKNDTHLFKFLAKMGKPKNWLDFRSYYWRDLLGMYRDGQPRTTPCPFIRDQFSLDSFGDVYYCFSTKSIGNWRKTKSISKIYFDDKNVNFRKKMTTSACLKCNSGCNVDKAIAKDMKKYLWFRLTQKPWFGFKKSILNK